MTTHSMSPARKGAPALADLAAGSAIREGLLVAAGVVVLAGSAQIAIPLPFTPVPITGQTFAVLLIGAGYGLWRSVGTMLGYLAVGFAGAPVFSPNAATGRTRTVDQVLHAPSFGYIVGMVAAMAVLGWLTSRQWDRRLGSSAAQMALASVVIYAVGLPWLAVAAHLSVGATVAKGLLPFLIGDVIKLLLAAALVPSVWRFVGRSRGADQA